MNAVQSDAFLLIFTQRMDETAPRSMDGAGEVEGTEASP